MKSLPLFIFILISFWCRSQNAWTLQECINYAKAHNISLQQAELSNEIKKNNELQSKAGLLPSINGGANHAYNFGKTIDRFTNTFANSQVLSQNFFLSGQVTLWSGLNQYNVIKANEFDYLSGVENIKQQQNDLSLTIANAYIAVIFNEELLKISQNQFEITREQMERTKKLVAAGSQARSVEYEIRSQLALEEANFTAADNNYQLSLLQLRQLMNLDSITNFKIERPDMTSLQEKTLSTDIQSMYEKSLQTQPGVKSSEYSILSAERRLAATKGLRSPTLTFNASMGTGTSGLAKDIVGVTVTGLQQSGVTSSGELVYTPVTQLITQPKPFADQFKSNVNKSLGFQLNVPIYNGLQTHTAIKNAQINALNAKLSQDLTHQTLYKNIAQAYANAKAALNNYLAQKASVEAAQVSFDYSKQKFEAGVISAFDYNMSKTKLFSAESNLLRSKYDYVFKMQVLDYYQGLPLGF
jgi:outer membrane protein